MSVSGRRLAPLVAVTGVSAVLVVTAFNPVPHSGGDNAGYLSLAYGLLTDGSYTEAFDPQRLPHTKYPPVFPALLALLAWLGARSWVAFKATAAVATVATVGLTYLWAERRVGAAAAFAVAVLLSASAAVVDYSHWILSDPVFVALTMLSLVALDQAEAAPEDGGWLAAGVCAAGLALFTRQAGLPLVLAIGGWLALSGRWRALAATTAAIGAPWLAWWWRSRGVAVASYGEEFWMVDPYDPGLGTVGLLGLVPRAAANLGAYVLGHVPAGVVGWDMPALGLLGIALTAAAVAGWAMRARDRVGPAEIFFAGYAGLILAWPEVWAGDRFALPLYPLAFVYGALALRSVAGRLPGPAKPALGAAAFLLLLLPAGRAWARSVSTASACAQAARQAGAFACHGPGVGAFVEAATWAGRALPEGSAVFSRKPRHFYVLSGLPSRTFPFDTDPDAHLTLADDLGVRYVLLDEWDVQTTRFVGAAVLGRPRAFCYVRAFGQPGWGGAQLLGILPPEDREGAGEGFEVGLASCPPAYWADVVEDYSPSTSDGRVPLLSGLDS